MAQASNDEAGRAPVEGLPVSFAEFLVSLGTTALVHLGEIPDPAEGRVKRNLPLARHGIDVLRMLREKTAGNLDGDESRLISALIDDLESKYRAVRAG